MKSSTILLALLTIRLSVGLSGLAALLATQLGYAQSALPIPTDGHSFLAWQRGLGTTGGGPDNGDFNGDGSVDFDDYPAWISGFSFILPDGTSGQPSLGPADPGTAKAGYKALTGELIVSVNGILAWSIRSDGNMSGPDDPMLPVVAGALNTNNDNRVGQATFFTPLFYAEHNLGRVARPGIPLNNLVLTYVKNLGDREVFVPLVLIRSIPEPSTLAIALVAFAVLRHRREGQPRCSL